MLFTHAKFNQSVKREPLIEECTPATSLVDIKPEDDYEPSVANEEAELFP